MTVHRAEAWPNNAAMIAALHAAGMIEDTYTLDATYGRGKWWTEWRPTTLVTNDHDPELDADHQIDFRRAEDSSLMWLGPFAQIAFDPPYIARGGTATNASVQDHHDRYGLGDTTSTPRQIADDIAAGIRSLAQLLDRGGRLYVKCQDYVSGGRLQTGTFWAIQAALSCNLRIHDRIVHITGTGPQPARDYQHHARSNCSELLILVRPPRWKLPAT